jgi:hypothetical protein
MPRKSKLDIIAQVVELENSLASLTFKHHGCIYFRDAIPGETAASELLVTNPPISSAMSDRFTLGPLG